MERNHAIDAIKGFAIVLVMLGHCIVLNGLNDSDPYIYDAIKAVQMPLFMLVSGVVASYSLRKNGKDSGLKKLPRRAVSYLVPFFSWFVLVYLCTHLLSGNISLGGFWEELRLLLFQTDRGLWFLMTLFIVTSCTMLAQTVADKICGASCLTWKNTLLQPGIFLLVEGLFYGLFFLQSRSSNTFLSPSLTVQYFPFYLLGYVGNGYIVDHCPLKSKSAKRLFLCLCTVSLFFFVGLVVAFDLTAPVDGIKTLAIQMLASLLGTAGIYGIVYELALHGCKGLFTFAGMYTLEIYVLHFRFARLLGLAQKDLQFYSAEGLWWLTAAFLLMSLLTALSIWLIKKSRVLDFILFGKNRFH